MQSHMTCSYACLKVYVYVHICIYIFCRLVVTKVVHTGFKVEMTVLQALAQAKSH